MTASKTGKPSKSSKITKAAKKTSHVASHILMVEPTAFYSNSQTMEDNAYMNKTKLTKK